MARNYQMEGFLDCVEDHEAARTIEPYASSRTYNYILDIDQGDASKANCISE